MELLKKGMKYREIARKMGFSHAVIQRRMKAKVGNAQKRYIWVAYNKEGKAVVAARTAADLGAILECSPERIRMREKRYRVGESKTLFIRRFLEGSREAREVLND